MSTLLRYSTLLPIFLGLILLFFNACQAPEGNDRKTIISVFNPPNKLAIQPLGDVPKANTDAVKAAIEQYYEIEVSVLPTKELPKHAFTQIKTPRYRADKILSWLKSNRPAEFTHQMAVTGKDISTTKRDPNGKVKKPESRYLDWGVFGLGYKPGCCSVISDYRLKNIDSHLSMERLKKVALHEFGHNLGLPHCADKKCVMQDAAESIRTIDNVQPVLCTSCYRSVH